MANIFTEMDSGSSGGGAPGNLTPAQLQEILAYRTNGQYSENPNVGGADFWEARGGVGNNNFRLYGLPTLDYVGNGDSQTPVERGAQNYVTRVRGDTGGRLGDWWNTDGTYGGTFDVNSPSAEFNTAAALIAGGYFGGNALDAAYGTGAGTTAATAATTGATTGGMSAAEQIAFLSANGMSDAAIVQAYPALAQAGGLTGVTGGTALGGGIKLLDTAKTVYDGVNQFLDSGIGKTLVTGAGLALMDDAKTGDPTNIQKVGDDAVTRANANDDYFSSTFLPQYLRLMQDAQGRDREMYDFNMGRARRAAGQMDQFYDAVDHYNSDDSRAQMRGEAVARTRQANNINVGINQRRMNAMGLNPNSGAYGTMMGQLASRSALLEAQAANTVERAARAEGINLRGQAAGLRGADLGYASNALQGANFGMNAVNQAQNGWQNNNAGWNATTNLGLGAFNTLYQGETSANMANTSGWNGVIGYGLGQLWNRRS